jgi:hypothetical protein
VSRIRPSGSAQNVSVGRWAARKPLAVLAVALTLNFGLRLFYVFEYSRTSLVTATATGMAAGDAGDYLLIAHTLNQTGRYGRLLGATPDDIMVGRAPAAPGDVEPDAWRPPLWPVVLAGLLKVAGYHWTSVLLLRFALDAVTVVLFWCLLVSLEAPFVALATALTLLAVHPAWLLYSSTLLSEPLTLLLQVGLALAMCLMARPPRSLTLAAVAGAVAGLGVMAHSYYVLTMFIGLALMSRARLVRRAQVLVAVVVFVCVCTPWIYRNMLVFGTRQPFLTSSQGNVLAMGWNDAFLATYRNSTAEVELSGTSPEVDLAGLDQPSRSAAQTRGAVEFARRNWRLLPAIVARKLAGAITPFPETPRSGLLEVGRAVFACAALVPLFLLMRSSVGGTRLRATAIGAVAAYLVMSVLTYPALRFRFPLIWVEMAAVGYSISALLTRLASSRATPRNTSSYRAP